MRQYDISESPCPTCLKTSFTTFISLIDMTALLNARKEALTKSKQVKVDIELPMLLGVKGKAVYIFDGNKV